MQLGCHLAVVAVCCEIIAENPSIADNTPKTSMLDGDDCTITLSFVKTS